MKKVNLLILSLLLMGSSTSIMSCRKCGHCSTTCGSVTTNGGTVCSGNDNYNTAQAACNSTNGTGGCTALWVE